METAVPGPFESKALTGTFEKDISCIQQNDIWSSETFNNFVNTVYKLFYTESSYDHIFRNAGPGVQARLLWEKPLVENNRDGESLSIPVLRFTAIEAEDSKYISIKLAPSMDPANQFDRLCLVYGNGDLSRSSRSYAMIHIPREETSTLSGDHVQYDVAVNENYCIIQCVYNLQTSNTEVPQRRRFHDLSEFVLKYDRSIAEGDTTITAVAGDKLIAGYNVPVKYTLTFGRSARLSNFMECVDNLTYNEFPLYKAKLVGTSAAADEKLWHALGFEETGTSAVVSKVIRFVPIRPAVNFYGWYAAASNLGKLLAYGIPDGAESNAEAVFKYTGTYGFRLDNRLDAPVVQYAGKLKAPLIYIPNKNNYHHYEPAASTTAPYPLPDWYEALFNADVLLGTTQDFSDDYFFLPLLTVHEKYLELAGMTVSLETLLDRGETDLSIVPGTADGTDIESEVRYDSYRFAGGNGPSNEVREPLVNAADHVFDAFKPALNAFETETSAPVLGRGVFPAASMLKSWNNAMALDRTLQAVVGLDWKLNNIIWIDPLLGPSENDGDPWAACDRQRKMYSSVRLAILDDVKFGRGSLITPSTIFIHVTDSASDAPEYSNDPADERYQNDESVYHRNMWREIYSEYLPAGCRHIALRAVSNAKVTESGFGLDYDHGFTPLYLRLLQDPGLNYTDGEYVSRLVAEGKFLTHLWCRYRLTDNPDDPDGYRDLDTDYYPLRSQDFSLTSNVIIDDPTAGMRVVEKITDVKIRLDGIKAETLSYIPRTHSLNTETGFYYSQTTGVSLVNPVGALVPVPLNSDWRPADWDRRGLLDWSVYNGEVSVQDCMIRGLNQSIELHAEAPVVRGVCISHLTVGPHSVTDTIVCRMGAAALTPPADIPVTVPAAGKLQLWRSETLSCTAEVSELTLCGAGGTQSIDYAPVAWPFNEKYYDGEDGPVYMMSPLSVAYHYTVDPDTGHYDGDGSRNYLCQLGTTDNGAGPKTAVTGGSIELTLRIEDRSAVSAQDEELRPMDCETRYLEDRQYRQSFRSFIKLNAPVTDCKFTVRIKDTGNRYNWYPPNSDPSDPGAPYYTPGTWQAFDPDLFLPLAPWVQNGTSEQWDWPANFTFIEGDSRNTDTSAALPVFSQCNILIDQSQDAVYWMPESVRFAADSYDYYPEKPEYIPCNMFFASRIFRKSSYIFYLAGVSPALVSGNTSAGQCTQCSKAVSITFNPGSGLSALYAPQKTIRRTILWRPQPEDADGLPHQQGYTSYFTYKTDIFLAGLTSSSIQIPELKVVTVIRKLTTQSELSSALPRQGAGTCIALFSCVSDTSVSIGRLDTRYPLIDEWQYTATGYPANPEPLSPVVYWAEPANGFLLFTYPEYLQESETIPAQVNRNNDISIGIWTTRTLLSGVHGLQGSFLRIAYDFTTQSGDLLVFSSRSNQYWDTTWQNLPENLETRPGSLYYTAQRPRYWTQLDSDPGRADEADGADSTHDIISYLPCLPLFYLSEVQDCILNTGLASYTSTSDTDSGLPTLPNDFISSGMPCNTIQIRPGRRTLRDYTYDTLRQPGSALPHADKSIRREDRPPLPVQYVAYNARRTLRLALGFQIQRSNDGVRLLTTASGNTVTGVFTRANIVAGLYNHVSGWCYELVPTYDEEVYHLLSTYYAGGQSDTSYQYPSKEGESWYFLQSPLFDHSKKTQNNRVGVVRRLLTLDIAVPGCRNASTPENEREIFDILAFQQWQGSAQPGSLTDGDSISHLATGICDRLITTIHNAADSPHLTSVSVPVVDCYQIMSDSTEIPLVSGGFTSVTDAYNTADLRTILLPCSAINYTAEDPTLTIPAYHPLHTVLCYSEPAGN